MADEKAKPPSPEETGASGAPAGDIPRITFSDGSLNLPAPPREEELSYWVGSPHDDIRFADELMRGQARAEAMGGANTAEDLGDAIATTLEARAANAPDSEPSVGEQWLRWKHGSEPYWDLVRGPGGPATPEPGGEPERGAGNSLPDDAPAIEDEAQESPPELTDDADDGGWAPADLDETDSDPEPEYWDDPVPDDGAPDAGDWDTSPEAAPDAPADSEFLGCGEHGSAGDGGSPAAADVIPAAADTPFDAGADTAPETAPADIAPPAPDLSGRSEF